jgi:hypothetical protein
LNLSGRATTSRLPARRGAKLLVVLPQDVGRHGAVIGTGQGYDPRTCNDQVAPGQDAIDTQ